MRRSILPAALAALLMAAPAAAEAPADPFRSIDGGTISLSDHAGAPVLLVNTASLCGFTPQYEALQALWESRRERGLLVIAVPSDSFRQELGSEEAVAEFCEVNFGIDLPMTAITDVAGADAHPVYRWLAAEGFRPAWNFSKALIGPDGALVASWGPAADPMGRDITAAVDALLPPPS